MASSLAADAFFNLSTQHQFNYNKELIYVKLTDSALRAIEEYARNQVGIRSSPLSLFVIPLDPFSTHVNQQNATKCPILRRILEEKKFRKSN
jgi:RNA polymerase II elongation factor ELL